ncbi:MAG TPA: hypothetical protein PKK05_07655 [Leptospiraceae bacterium]|nr:hypothetical protein [Leptospiraceae bacterium]
MNSSENEFGCTYLSEEDAVSVLDDFFSALTDRTVSFDQESVSEYFRKNAFLTKDAADSLAKALISSISDPEEIQYSVVFKKKFRFKDFLLWDKEVHEAAEEFKKEFSLYPVLLAAAPQTLSRIDMIVNFGSRDRIKNTENSSLEKGEFAQLGGFSSDNFELDFAADSELEDREFLLIFDSDPDWGGESKDIPEDAEEESKAA